MTSPLSPAQDVALNYSTPGTTRRYGKYEVQAFSMESKLPADDAQNSSPFISTVNDTKTSDQENLSPSKKRHNRVLSGTELSPLKILAEPRKRSRSGSFENTGPPSVRSPRKASPEKRFPVKISAPSEILRVTEPRTMDLDDAVRQNDGLRKAIEIFEDEQSTLEDDGKHNSSPPVINVDNSLVEDDAAHPDDTMASTFSTFSAVPSLTMFAQMSQSPSKFSTFGGLTPKPRLDPSAQRSSRPASADESGNTTSLLMDFTEQFRLQQKRSPGKQGGLASSRTAPNVSETPGRQFTNLIDFDIPPMPTPRSVPSVTPRELESLKSNFLSEISSLKASLSGKEAEVHSLKTAVGDAEKRVGESMEQLREERSAKEHLAAEREGWEDRGREMEKVLRKVKDEIMTGQREREELEQKLDESEKRREAAEMLHQEAESKMAGMRAGKDTENASPEKVRSPGASTRDVEVAVERVARELHALYKSKHETKVSALKKSYESRWEKKIRELESRVEQLNEENDKLRAGHDASMTKIDPGSTETEERKAQAVKDSAAIKELTADVQRLEAVVTTVKRDNDDLRGMLEKERVEKGELVQLAEEMMSMQSFVGSQQQQQSRRQSQQIERPDLTKTPKSSGDNLRSNIHRSGIKAPGSNLRVPHERNKSNGGLPRPGGIARSGIMSSIEKMGSYRGRAAE